VRRYWVGVASREHVLAAVRGGFAQLNHGKEAPLRQLRPGDRLLYYSPSEQIRSGKPVQAFTAISEVIDREPYQVFVSDRFRPFRQDVRYFDAREASIRPLLPHLSFSQRNSAWGQVLRRGVFRIQQGDYEMIAAAMQILDQSGQ
jgi:hypothetical protein